MTVVVSEVLGQELLEMTTSEDEEPVSAQPVQTLPADGANEPLGERIRARRSR